MNKGIEFEQECIRKLTQLGFINISSTPTSVDYGVDIVAYHNNLKYIFQCKNWKKKPGEVVVREVLAAKQLYSADRCAVISKTGFTKQAFKLAKPNFILLINGDEFFEASSLSDLIKSFSSAPNLPLINHNYNIINEYESLKAQIGYTPTLDELGKTLRYKIRKHYKNYSTFLKAVGDRLKKCKPTEMQIKEEYVRIRRLLKKTPTAEEIRTNTTLPYNSFHTYPLTKLQKECGDIPNCDRSYTKEELIEEYLELEKKLGHKPNGTEIDKYGKHNSSLYLRVFGSLSEFYKNNRINAEHLIKKPLTRNETIVVYILLEEIFNYKGMKFPNSIRKLGNIQYQGEALLKSHQIEYAFSNITNFMSVLGNDINTLKFRKALKNLITNFMSVSFDL